MSYNLFDSEAALGYTQISTFFQDFTIAEIFGTEAIVDTYHRALEDWKNNYKMLTELVLVLNWKIWEHYKTSETVARIYNQLWQEASEYALDNFKDDELKYYLDTTD